MRKKRKKQKRGKKTEETCLDSNCDSRKAAETERESSCYCGVSRCCFYCSLHRFRYHSD